MKPMAVSFVELSCALTSRKRLAASLTNTMTRVLLLALLWSSNIILGGICLAVARRDRASRALRLWGAGLVVYALGLLVTISTFLPAALSKIGGNALICYAPILCINGALKHTQFPDEHSAGCWPASSRR